MSESNASPRDQSIAELESRFGDQLRYVGEHFAITRIDFGASSSSFVVWLLHTGGTVERFDRLKHARAFVDDMDRVGDDMNELAAGDAQWGYTWPDMERRRELVCSTNEAYLAARR